MRIVVTDLETWWDNEHTLSKMSPIEYCTSPKTEVISLGIKVGNYPTDVLFGEEAIAKALSKMDFSDSIVVGHNLSGFDAMILAWRFGVRPKMWGCTLAMARPIHAKTTGNSLEKLVAHYGLGVKDKTALVNTKGKRLKDFTPQELDAMREYNRSDVEQCRALFDILRKHYSAKELWLIDATIRMLVEPGFEVDTGLLEIALTVERDHKRKLIYEVARLLRERGLSEERPEDFSAESVEEHIRKDLASAAKFARVLETFGVEVPTKPSPADPTKRIPALAKTDEGFLKLVEHKNELVAAAARARLSIKSTLLETRIEAFLRTAKALGGKLPAPLHYCGADTTGRWSGWAFNLQNLPRITPGKPKASDALRKSLRAPKGYKVVVADQSGIELRVNHFLWQVPESMELYNKDPQADLYRAFAAARYGVKPEEVTKEQRQLAKLCLAEGTLVLTDRGEVPIEQVTASDKVWDGVEWVSTLGPVFKGVKDVIEYDGLVATPDHEVWVEDGRKVPLWYAATQSLRLARTGDAGVPLGFGGTGVERDAEVEGVSGGTDTLHELRHSEVGQLRQPSSWPDAGLPTVPAEVRGTCVALAEDGSREATLHQPERRGLQAVRRSGYSVPVPVGGGGRSVGDDQPWPAPGQGAGPHRQQRPLRAGKLAVGKPQAECSQSRAQQVENLSPVSGDAPGGSLCGQHPAKPAEQGADVRGDCGSVEPPIRQTQRRVWDLLNCGPRHRFTANGRLVSNCQLGLGFGAGWRTFKRVAKLMGGLDLSDEEAEAVTTAWRTQYAEIVLGWRKCHAALTAIYAGEETEIDPWGLCKTTSEGIALPSGRVIRYPALHQETNDEGKTEWWYGTGRHRARIYAGKVTENCVQALARDIIADNAVEFYKVTKFRPALMVHDELVYIVPESQAKDALEELQKIMRTPPKWWPELVTWSEGDLANSYGDAK